MVANSKAKLYDCLIVGGGPAGLLAATYLGRFRRKVLVIDSGQSRAKLIPLTRNCPGFPDGISGPALLGRLRRQASRYNVRFLEGYVTQLFCSRGTFSAKPTNVRARATLIATGVVDVLPDIPELDMLITRGRIRICPVCDAFETIDRSLAVIGPSANAVAKAEFLQPYTRKISILATGTLDNEGRAAAAGLDIAVANPASIRATDDGVSVRLIGGERRVFDAIYPAMGATINSRVAADLGAECDELGNLVTDARQRTAVPGMYAAGDVVNELNQLSVAFGHAAIAASDIHRYLDRPVL
ncbi:NAD(P)/FAD-dependent oxidoreductase [Aminobacter aganoensis]|uniref:Thioredoxin reductase n=1 Tax=Aminobacter aganoensis TaxID=83264 RepID=A0A7X0FCB8_9HYPH|nr:NAD(P)/FAD-dependent oxidoreductase [Aminobacter aganoensis]MBB6357111.1 thioredoxin reductase (NADPH) [Aminobacter aganoensis]